MSPTLVLMISMLSLSDASVEKKGFDSSNEGREKDQ